MMNYAERRSPEHLKANAFAFSTVVATFRNDIQTRLEEINRDLPGFNTWPLSDREAQVAVYVIGEFAYNLADTYGPHAQSLVEVQDAYKRRVRDYLNDFRGAGQHKRIETLWQMVQSFVKVNSLLGGTE